MDWTDRVVLTLDRVPAAIDRVVVATLRIATEYLRNVIERLQRFFIKLLRMFAKFIAVFSIALFLWSVIGAGDEFARHTTNSHFAILNISAAWMLRILGYGGAVLAVGTLPFSLRRALDADRFAETLVDEIIAKDLPNGNPAPEARAVLLEAAKGNLEFECAGEQLAKHGRKSAKAEIRWLRELYKAARPHYARFIVLDALVLAVVGWCSVAHYSFQAYPLVQLQALVLPVVKLLQHLPR